MLKIKTIIFILCFCSYVHAESWYSFKDESMGEERSIGFKDKNGNTRIKPSFGGLTHVNRFDDIIAVHEVFSNRSETYYLLKSGKKIGHDMMWIEDLTFDCENERHIRFKDTKKDFVGMFNYKGDIVIPPIYSFLSKVHNGLVIGRLNAKKEYWAEHNESGCNHYSLVGGKIILLNTKNEVLIEDFDTDLDLYSLHIEQQPSIKKYEKSYLGENGKYYIFEKYDSKFETWFIENILHNINIESLYKHLNEEVIVGHNKKVTVKSKDEFIKNDFNTLKKRLTVLKNKKDEYHVDVGDLNSSGINLLENLSTKYLRFSNNCYRYKSLKYPTLTYFLEMIIGDNKYITFLKTDDGYKLIETSI